LYDFDEPIGVEAPPQDQVSDVRELEIPQEVLDECDGTEREEEGEDEEELSASESLERVELFSGCLEASESTDAVDVTSLVTCMNARPETELYECLFEADGDADGLLTIDEFIASCAIDPEALTEFQPVPSEDEPGSGSWDEAEPGD
jgi:hypothetical protein